jgi:SAM-dependent methyltransferase
MPHQDYEKYALQRPMDGFVSEKYSSFFNENVLPLLGKSFTILDFGCGDGKYFNFFKKYMDQGNIFGTEVSETRTRRCREIGWHNVQKVKPLQPLPFADSSFDLINFDQVIEHIPADDVGFYLGEMNRVLVDGGLIIMITPNYPVKRFYDVFNAILKMDPRRARDDPTHIARYSFRTIRDILADYFKLLKLEPTGGIVWEILRYDVFSHKIIGLLQKR